jgi:heme oxygenase
VEEKLHFAPGQGNAYFQGHGDQTGSMWREVTARIAAVPEEETERVIAAAKRTFIAFGEALRAGLAPGLARG